MNYYLGLDLGTSSLGWSVADENYQVVRVRGKNMMGIHLFDEAETAEARRLFRGSRRRLRRRANRIKILRDLFAEEISKVDPGFYQRLDDSFFYPDDKEVEQSNSLFNDPDFTDKDFYSQYPTIYHLRKALIEGGKSFDIRLLYLALHNILKYRGHFLFPGKEISMANNIEELLDTLNDYIDSRYLDNDSIEPIEKEVYPALVEILTNKNLSSRDKDKQLRDLLGVKNTDLIMRILKLAKGDTVDLKFLFPQVLEDESLKLSFKNDFEEFLSSNQSHLDNQAIDLLQILKLLYDSIAFLDIIGTNEYISQAKVRSYEDHKRDLKDLKKVYKENLKKKYKSFFRGPESSYQKYIDGSLDQEKINKNISNDLKGLDQEEKTIKRLMEDAALLRLLPKQKVSSNSTIPMQIHRLELTKILDQATHNFDFLNQKDESGISVKDKIIATFDFRIPYYVGPLSDKDRIEDGGFSWIVKKTNTQILPWNFDQVVDQEASAEKFIRNLTNTCTYLVGEDVLPKESLLYQEYEVLNEINNIKINNIPITPEFKDYIFHEFFKKELVNLTKKNLKKTLISRGKLQANDILTGIDFKVNSNLSSYHMLKNIVGEQVNDREKMENIILWSTLYNDAKSILKNKIQNEYGDFFTEEQIKRLSKLNFKNWGRLSKKLLVGTIPGASNNRELQDISIIDALRKTNKNLMELLSSNYGYAQQIEEENMGLFRGESIDNLIEESYASPAVKRMINRTMNLVKEIETIMGGEPTRVFIEMARQKDEQPTRKDSRKNQLINLYKSIKEGERDWEKELNAYSESQFRSKKLYLYYTQMGRCMYSGEKISIDNLFDKNIYDIDHIYPRSKTKDDSIINNLVLVKKTKNLEKGDIYPLPPSFQEKNAKLWYLLMQRGLISKTKYERLTRMSGFTAEELSDFINRQLVETRQSSKEVARILKHHFKKSQIVYVKASNISEFRHQFNLLKSRDVNDYHHAHDAYLAIVVGNTYYSKFTANPANYIKKNGGTNVRNYNLNKLFLQTQFNHEGNVVWSPDLHLSQVKDTLNEHWLQFTRYSYVAKGAFFDQQLVGKYKASKGTGYHPIKSKDPRLSDLSRYGGYSRMKNSYFCLVEHESGRKKLRTILSLPIVYKDKFENLRGLDRYCREDLGLKNHKIICEKIKYNSLLRLNGFFYHIAGKSGESYQLRPAVQLDLPIEDQKIIRAMRQLIDGKPISSYHEKYLSSDKLLSLYDQLLNKFNHTVYKNRMNKIDKIMENGRGDFMELTTEAKVRILMAVILNMGAEKISADLRPIGGSASSGIISISKNINNYEEFILINQSITGIFTNQFDLLRDFNELENSNNL